MGRPISFIAAINGQLQLFSRTTGDDLVGTSNNAHEIAALFAEHGIHDRGLYLSSTMDYDVEDGGFEYSGQAHELLTTALSIYKAPADTTTTTASGDVWALGTMV